MIYRKHGSDIKGVDRAFCPLGSVLQFRGSFFFSSRKLNMGNVVICCVLHVWGLLTQLQDSLPMF